MSDPYVHVAFGDSTVAVASKAGSGQVCVVADFRYRLLMSTSTALLNLKWNSGRPRKLRLA